VPTRAPGAEAFVRIWERGQYEHPLDRALTMLSALSRRPRSELAALSVEHRDRLLLALRSQLFGPNLAAMAACPGCGCAVDVSIAAGGAEPSGEDRFTVSAAGTSVEVRMPTSLDLAAAAAGGSVDAARRLLVRRCIESSLDEAELDAVADAVESELDRRADVSAGAVGLTCPECAAQWTLELDVPAFMFKEIEILAGRLLRSVDVLARRYGWSEAEILGLSPDRRRFYLELAS
jgi:hypothetical protein